MNSIIDLIFYLFMIFYYRYNLFIFHENNFYYRFDMIFHAL